MAEPKSPLHEVAARWGTAFGAELERVSMVLQDNQVSAEIVAILLGTQAHGQRQDIQAVVASVTALVEGGYQAARLRAEATKGAPS